MSIRSLKYSFTLMLILAQLAATTGYTAMIHYCRMAVAAPDATAAACCCVEETAPEAEPAQACCHAGSAQKGAAAEGATGECAADNSTAVQFAIEANTADAGAAERPQPGLGRAPCCEFVSHFHHVDETAPLATSTPTLVPAFFLILPPPDRHAPHVSVAAFASAPPDFQHTLPLLI